MTFLLNLITAAVLYGTPLLYGTSGEILTEKSGNLNLGGHDVHGRRPGPGRGVLL